MCKQHGNILFLILIAVVLFAALSYAVTQSSRGGGNADKEQLELRTASFVNYSNNIAVTVDRLLISQRCAENELSFEKSPFDGTDSDYVNSDAPLDFSCHIYHPQGGGIPSPNVGDFQGIVGQTSEYEVYGSTNNSIAGVLHPTSGYAADLSIIVRGVSENACISINESIGITLPIPIDSGDLNVAPFDGDYTSVDNVDGTINYASSPWVGVGSEYSCFEEQATGDFIYFHVLHGR